MYPASSPRPSKCFSICSRKKGREEGNREARKEGRGGKGRERPSTFPCFHLSVSFLFSPSLSLLSVLISKVLKSLPRTICRRRARIMFLSLPSRLGPAGCPALAPTAGEPPRTAAPQPQDVETLEGSRQLFPRRVPEAGRPAGRQGWRGRAGARGTPRPGVVGGGAQRRGEERKEGGRVGGGAARGGPERAPLPAQPAPSQPSRPHLAAAPSLVSAASRLRRWLEAAHLGLETYKGAASSGGNGRRRRGLGRGGRTMRR